MINETDILHEGHGRYFACHTGEKAAGLLYAITYHHKTVVELGENGLNPLSELFCMPMLATSKKFCCTSVPR